MAKPSIETLTLWDGAVKSWESGDRNEAFKKFSQIDAQQRTAKILFNVGSIHLVEKRYKDSYKILAETVERDPHSAIGYFQLGCVLFHLKKYKESGSMFEECHSKLRGKTIIDYNQLDLRHKLYACEALHNLGVTLAHRNLLDAAKEKVIKAQESKVESKHKAIDSTLESLQSGRTCDLIELPEGCLYRPSKKLMQSIPKVDYLGEAEVIVAQDEESAKFKGFDGPRTKELLLQNGGSPRISPGRSPGESPKSGGSPKFGRFFGRFKGDDDRKMSAPTVMITKSEKEALKKLQKKGLSVSEENSPSATMGYTGQSRAALLPPGKNRELRPGGTMERVLANKLLQKKSPTGSPDVSPGSTLERKPALPPKRDTDPTSSKESIESSPSSQSPKLKSGGYMMQGRYIPPPPKRPPPKLKLDEPLPPLPDENSNTVNTAPPPPPPKLSPKPAKLTSVTLHCRTDEIVKVKHGTKLVDLLQEASTKFRLLLGQFDLWAREGGTGNMEAIQDEDDMRLVWSHVSDGKLELWCFGKE